MNNNATETKDENAKLVHFFVDGEKCESVLATLTPNFIISTFAALDSATHYLVKIHGNDRESYQETATVAIDLHNGDRFQVISLGPTPVSDTGLTTGVQRFSNELRALGYEVTSLPNLPDHITVDYVVETGAFAKRAFKLGFVVPSDFPLTCPSGPMIGANLHPINPSGVHPTGGIHAGHAAAFQAALGGEWQYWSRPFSGWNSSKKTVLSYMNHVWRLMDSQ